MTIETRRAWDGGFSFDFDTDGGEVDPAVVAAPTSAHSGAVMTAVVVDGTTTIGTRHVPQVRTLSVPRPRYRVTIGGKDVSWLLGARLPMPSWYLVAPLLYGSGSLSLPQFNAVYDRAGVGDWSWLRKFAPVKIQLLNDDDTVASTVYRGFLPDFDHNSRAFSSGPGGEATGAAAMADRPAPIFPTAQDVGPLVMSTLQHDLRVPIKNSPTTGIKLADTGGMSQLEFLSETLAKSTEKDGTQWTVMPNASGLYRMFQKDTTTVAATVYIDGARVSESLRRDFTEEPNRIWAQGIDPDGKRIRFAIIPGLPSPGASAPAYPGSPLNPGDSGDDVLTVAWQLFTVGYLDDAPLSLTWTTDPDDPLTQAIEDLQDDAGLTANGTVNAATWKAIFNPDITGYSLRRAQIKPAAQRSFTQKFLRDATGNIIGENPNYDRTKPLVDAMVDTGSGFTRRQTQRWAKNELADENTANWVGTVTVNTGAVIDGSHNPGDPLTTDLVRDARSIQPGMNLWLANWDGGTLVHVSGVTVSPGPSGLSVEFAVDTRARDTMKVWEVIARNRESRKSPARQWIAQNRRSGLRDDSGAFYDGGSFGRIPRTLCPADTWTVIAAPGGRSGILNLIDIQTGTDAAAFGLAIFGKQVDTDWCDRHLGDWTDSGFQDRVQTNTKTWQDNRGLVDVWGTNDQPCGYWPRQHTGSDGTTTDAPITGQFRFKAGTPYLCQGSPVLWIAIRPDRDTWVQGGRVLDLLLDDAAS